MEDRTLFDFLLFTAQQAAEMYDPAYTPDQRQEQTIKVNEYEARLKLYMESQGNSELLWKLYEQLKSELAYRKELHGFLEEWKLDGDFFAYHMENTP